jgi:gliding motility-associated-like protein
VRKILLPFLLFYTSLLSAQISAPGSNATRTSDYLSGGDNHPIFIYCASGSPSPSLQAVSPGGTGPFDFEWTQWDSFSSDFTISLGTDAGVSSSERSALGEGGYKVRITDGGGYDTSLIAWIHIDQPNALAELQNRSCYYVALNGTVSTDSYNYYDIVGGQAIQLPNDIEFLWSSTPTSSIPYPALEIDPITYNPPLEDVEYNLQVTDSFGCSANSSFDYLSIHVNADFEIDPSEGEAPLEVFITDLSVRALDYTWRFGDDTISNSSIPISHTYYVPGQYSISLSIESDLGCIDSMRIDNIVVQPSSLNIPNVFTPDGDGNNEFFYVESRSLRSIDVQVFSRAGIRVYNYQGDEDSIKDWQGWDGKIGSSKASPGIYYYIIRAVGWDNEIYDSKAHRGFVYLFR